MTDQTLKTTLSIKVIYSSSNLGELAKKSFCSDIKFKEILDYYKNNIQPLKPNTKLKSFYYYNDKKILDSTNITDLITISEDIKIVNIKIQITVDDITPILSTYNFYTKILKLKSSPFRLLKYSVNDNKISIQNIPEHSLNLSNIFKFNEIDSASCNSYENLYVSGGTFNNKIQDDFWIINNENFQIENIKMLAPKKNHSMLYINSLNYIIIVGGNDKKCFLFDITNKIFKNLPELNDIHLEPALCVSDNYLYCLSSFDKNKKFFEKIYLSNNYDLKQIKWEKIYPKYYLSYNNKLFGIAKINDNIILACGEKTEKNTILFDTKNNLVNKSKGIDQNCILDDKTFYIINENYGIAFPKKFDFEKDVINYVMLINLKKNEVQKEFFDIDGKLRFDFIKDNDIGNDENIKIETKIIKKKDKNSNNKANYDNNTNENNCTDQFENINDVYTNNIKEENLKENSTGKDGNEFINDNIVIDGSNQIEDLYDPYSIIKCAKKAPKSTFYLPKKYYDNELIKQEIHLNNNNIEPELTEPIIIKKKTKIKENEEILNFESVPDDENIIHNQITKKKNVLYVNKNMYDSQIVNKQIINNYPFGTKTLLNENSTIERKFKNGEDGNEKNELNIELLEKLITDKKSNKSYKNKNQTNNNSIVFDNNFNNVSEIKEESIPQNITSNTTLKEHKKNLENKKMITQKNLNKTPNKKKREIIIKYYCIEPPRILFKSNINNRRLYTNKQISQPKTTQKMFNKSCIQQDNNSHK